MIGVVIAVVAFLIFVNALYVAAEFATVSARRARIFDLAEAGNLPARQLFPILEDRALLDRYVACCQVGITLSSLGVGYYGQAQLTPVVAPWLTSLGMGPVAATSTAATGLLLTLTLVQVILGELLPKSVALRYPERLALAVALPMRWSLAVLRPFIALLNGSALALMRAFDLQSTGERGHVHSPQELEAIFQESAEGGLIDAGERELLANVFHLSERVARQIMVPRTRIDAAEIDESPRELLGRLAHLPHTRFPVRGESVDEVLGLIHIQDLYALVKTDPEGDLRSIVHEVPMVPEAIRVDELWRLLRRERSSMAIVFDEYGGVSGMVTIEDILEEVFGEFQDEFDDERDLYRRDRTGTVMLRGDLLVSEVNERLLVQLPLDESDTIGGLVMARLGRIPREGDVADVDGVRLEATEVRGQAVRQVKLIANRVAEGNGHASEERPSASTSAATSEDGAAAAAAGHAFADAVGAAPEGGVEDTVAADPMDDLDAEIGLEASPDAPDEPPEGRDA